MSHGACVGPLTEYERPARHAQGRPATPPILQPRHRYSQAADSSDNEDGPAVSTPDQDVPTPLPDTGNTLHTATKLFMSKFGPACKGGAITVDTVAAELGLPITDVHALLAVLEVLEVRLHLWSKQAFATPSRPGTTTRAIACLPCAHAVEFAAQNACLYFKQHAQ